ncbi:MAG: SDR family NAD(P)-dependent oxidoreductase [Ardenticatenaceae bacterium]|nr:SDR family NAD(P)-dependent oxidoreductase [Anaerolineales bacterium]MCB8922086.1 SDR family NAD(P)-dependent oxidoreductase [Ardenticatenaceae bacterium]MCB9003202.1 SDR family NAD(P)-dependent oxidoreductase [Ardenticatenaceae bacterium]
MCEDTFAFIIHPIDPKRDVSRKYPALGKLPVWLIDFLSLFFPPVFISEISGIRSEGNGRSLSGWFIACPLTPRRMMTLPPGIVYKKIIQTGRLAEKLGAKILGLGAYTSVVGDGGVSIAKQMHIPVTTGDSYTIAIAVQAILEAARQINIPIARATVAIVGATGAIGNVCAQMLATQAAHIVLIGRREDRLRQIAENIRQVSGTDVTWTADIDELRHAHLIITVTSAVDTVIEPQHLRQGAVVCDVARPRDVSRQVAEQRPDVLVIEGGMVQVPGAVDFGFDFGFPPQMAYACMAETMALALEQRYESYTLGKDIKLSQVLTIDKIASRHGFKLGGFRSFERAVSEADIVKVRAYSQSSTLP